MICREGLFGIVVALAALTGCASGVTSDEPTDTTADRKIPREAEGQRAEMLSAFFGLDNTLPPLANLICTGAPGKDGMPVIFSTEIDHTTMQAGDFKVTTRSGETGVVHCVSLLPATDAGELRTVLLVGEFGNASDDPPARVEIIGHVESIDGTLDFKGSSIKVTPLEPGPTLVMAQIVSDDEEDMGLGLPRTKGSECPAQGIAQKVRVVWAGGVTLENGDEPGDKERELYKVTSQSAEGKRREVVPVALADLGDGDNNHLLCLDTQDKPISVAFPAGILTDPNDDLNPATSVVVQD
ncbi:hypothetical protein [Erythrobacter sp.]|uniref:hypothetical protein n=1 Tax=Erythrobacter sp. TaxID=1042 RepID=UPI0032EBCA26